LGPACPLALWLAVCGHIQPVMQNAMRFPTHLPDCTGCWFCLECPLQSWATNYKPLIQLIHEASYACSNLRERTLLMNVQNFQYFITSLVISHCNDQATCLPNRLNYISAGTLSTLCELPRTGTLGTEYTTHLVNE
jgi:hypothetical protein